MLIGALIAMILYGITTLQTYIYYMRYPRDKIALKVFVMVMWLLDSLHSSFVCYIIYYYLVTASQDPQLRDAGIWTLYVRCRHSASFTTAEQQISIQTSLLINIITALLVQCYFTERIHTLSTPPFRWWLTTVLAIFIFAHCCFGLDTVVQFFIQKDFDKLDVTRVTNTGPVPFALFAILSDIVIAAALCWLLRNNRSDFSDTNYIIDRLIVYAINRCILTSAVAVIEVVCFAILSNTFYSFAFDFAIGKLYANSFLASLNSREALRNHSTGGGSTELTTSFRVAPNPARQVSTLPHLLDVNLGFPGVDTVLTIVLVPQRSSTGTGMAQSFSFSPYQEADVTGRRTQSSTTTTKATMTLMPDEISTE
ncbi:hypothetical protein FISHEDRAFT_77786 [Fistulina hepatica ATCC 64428]|nr:hypothetical protein FISHEDRAFT_77786 [Fistulina hepatica ATCC 64428]